MMIVYIGLGSNLDNPANQLRQALASIEEHGDIEIQAVSSFYANPPMGPAEYDFINAVAKITTTLSPKALLDYFHSVEQKQNRIRKMKWGPRTIDLDILLYGNQQINLPELIIPHPGITERPFVVWPLLEIAPNLMLPNGISLKTLAKNIDNSQLTRVRDEHEYTCC